MGEGSTLSDWSAFAQGILKGYVEGDLRKRYGDPTAQPMRSANGGYYLEGESASYRPPVQPVESGIDTRVLLIGAAVVLGAVLLLRRG